MLQFFILILNFLIKNLNVVLLALCALFGDSEKKKICAVGSVVFRVAKICSYF